MNSKELTVVQEGRPPTQNVVFIRSGKELPLILLSYYDIPSITVIISLYDNPGYSIQDDWWVVCGGLSKFDSARLFLERFPLFLSANQVAFFDPDVEINWFDLNILLIKGDNAKCSLYQASLSRDSHSSWPFLFSKVSNSPWRKVSFVEVMAPIFKTSLLNNVFSLFSESISTWGLEYIWYSHADSSLLVCDHIQMKHVNPVNLSGGKFYSYLSGLGINPWDEKERLRSKYIYYPYLEADIPQWVPWNMNRSFFKLRQLLSKLLALLPSSPSFRFFLF